MMKRYTVSLMLFISILVIGTAPCSCTAQVKEPSVAGAFYPADKETLQKAVDSFLARAVRSSSDGRLIALIAPHAGYPYSGSVAGHAFAQLKGSGTDTVILIGPSHHTSFNGASVYAQGGMRTPLGVVPINETIARSLIDEKAGITFNTAAFDREHSLEVQLPFLQRTLKDFTIVPILIGTPTKESFALLVEKLTAVLRKNDRTIIVASTDLSHYHDHATALEMDNRVIDAVERLSDRDLHTSLMKRQGEMCGGFPVLYTLAIARTLGATSGVLYKRADSGDVTGDKRSVVGYAAMGLYRSPLSNKEKAELLTLARTTLVNHVTGKTLPEGSLQTPRLKADGACFVTLKERNGALRGCIGTIEPMMPLSRSVIANAISASSRDPRFPPVKAEELPNLEVEVTVLSPLEPLTDVKEINVGTHGLYLAKGMNSGVFLPQVAVENQWDVTTYLKELSHKAGLPDDGWKGAQLFTFTAEIIK